MLKLCKEYEVTPLAFGVQHFSKDHDANKKVFEFGKALGVRMFSADPDPDSFDSLDKLCDEYKIAIGIHPHGPQGKTPSLVSAEVILEAVKDHNTLIGSCLDTGHLIRAAQLGKKLDPAEEIRKMGPRNFGIHLKDHDNEKDTDVVFGKGVLDVPGVLQALREVKFQGHDQHRVRGQRRRADGGRASVHRGLQGVGQEAGVSRAGRGAFPERGAPSYHKQGDRTRTRCEPLPERRVRGFL